MTSETEKRKKARKRFAGLSNQRMRDLPLRVRIIDDGVLAIEVGLRTLEKIVEHGPLGMEWRVIDVDKLAKEVVVILANDEDEIGLTPLMHVIDAAIEQAVSDGSSAVEEIRGHEL